MAKEEPGLSHTSVYRPLSPHIGIYRVQMTSLSSISHRTTGILLYFGSFFWVGFLLLTAFCPQGFQAAQNALQTLPGKCFVGGAIFSLIYHWLSGIRHIVWTFAWGLYSCVACLTSLLIFLLSFLGTLGLVCNLFQLCNFLL